MDKATRILITGANGLAGYWLRQHLEYLEFESVHCLDTEINPNDSSIHAGSVCDPDFVRAVLEETGPEVVFHFAGLLGGAGGEELDRVNVGGTSTLIACLADTGLSETRVVLTSSSAVYGDKGRAPVSEEMRLEGKSVYALSKIRQEETALGLCERFGIPVIITRGFNNIAPGERKTMFVSKLAIQIAEIEADIRKTLEIGPLFSYRDYLDTRDLVEAYALIAEKGEPFEVYNVCSGEAIKIEDLFLFLISKAKAGIDYRIVEYDQGGNIPFQVGANDKLVRATGFSRKHDVKNTALEILDYWRERMAG